MLMDPCGNCADPRNGDGREIPPKWAMRMAMKNILDNRKGSGKIFSAQYMPH
jgi:hypothetical protein